MGLFGNKKNTNQNQFSYPEEVAPGVDNSLALNRLKPHFINNILSSVYYLCDSDPQRAQGVTMSFSAYLLSVIEAMNSDELIPFSKELDFIKSYIDIEHLRLEDRLNVDYDIYISDFKVPPLAIEALVEIAVKRSIPSKPGPCKLTISTRRIADDGIQLKIIDDGAGFDMKNPGFDASDIERVRGRLARELGAEMTVTSAPGKGTEIVITIRPDANRY